MNEFSSTTAIKGSTSGTHGSISIDTGKVLGGLIGGGCGLGILLLIVVCISRRRSARRNHELDTRYISETTQHYPSLLQFASRPLPQEPRPAPKTPDHDPYRKNPIIHEIPYPAKTVCTSRNLTENPFE